MTIPLLRRINPKNLPEQKYSANDDGIFEKTHKIVSDVRNDGANALRKYASIFDHLPPNEPLIKTQDELEAAFTSLPCDVRQLLQRIAERIRCFAVAQRECLLPLSMTINGGTCGHSIAAVERAGCYAPGGRFPLPSSVLMTVVTARTAGVDHVWVASPRPAPITLAAAHVAQADALIPAGGAHAIAALAYGAGPVPICDVIVGPGNKWVTAAKQLVAGQVRIDMLAGPSELVILADESADPALVAADLLAQSEHDPDAFPVLISMVEPLLDAVERALSQQIVTLSTKQTARRALSNGFCAFIPDLEHVLAVCDQLAPEHLELFLKNPQKVVSRLRHYGSLFIGSRAGEVLGDFGAGPNHVLPTGGTARFSGGLSVLNFLRVRTWLQINNTLADSTLLAADAAALARLEGLEAHARAADLRRTSSHSTKR